MYFVSGWVLKFGASLQPDPGTHITSCRNFTSIQFTASAVFVAFLLFLPLCSKRQQHIKLYYFQNISPGLILKIFLIFRKFHPRYCYKIYSYTVIKKQYMLCQRLSNRCRSFTVQQFCHGRLREISSLTNPQRCHGSTPHAVISCHQERNGYL